MSSPERVENVRFDAHHDSKVLPNAKLCVIEEDTILDYTSFAGKNEASIESLVEKIRTALASEEGKTVSVSRIDSEQADCLIDAIRAVGLRVKFEWDAKSKRASIWMAHEIHSKAPGIWWQRELPVLESALRAFSICDEQELWARGDSKMKYTDGSKFHPDASFSVQEGPLLTGKTRNPVVFECLNTQTLENGRARAQKIINHAKARVHVVILLNYEKQSGKKGLYRVTMEVWRRKLTGNPEIDYPLDGCPWVKGAAKASDDSATSKRDEDHLSSNGSASDHEAKDEPSDESEYDEDLDESTSDSEGDNDASGDFEPGEHQHLDEESFSEGSTMVSIHQPVDAEPVPSAAGDEPAFGPVVVFNEDETSSDAIADYLTLDVYDILRVCGKDPTRRVPDKERQVNISLESLRAGIAVCLRDLREEEKAEKKKKKRSASGDQGSFAKRQRTSAQGKRGGKGSKGGHRAAHRTTA